MNRNRNVTPQGRRGSRASVHHGRGKKTDLGQRDEIVPTQNPSTQPMASVGLSLTVGQSTEYAREKIEVSAWCTLPCEPDEEVMQATYEACYEFVAREIQERSSDALERFFPGMQQQE
jgi:hypothetical protein